LGVGYPSPSAAWRRLLVASLGVRESLPAQSPGEEAVVTVEVNLTPFLPRFISPP
jgi:hypothetical protein